jgi:hypothetical protein
MLKSSDGPVGYQLHYLIIRTLGNNGLDSAGEEEEHDI